MSNNDMFLYWGSGSPPCWKAMIVLAQKGLWDGLKYKLCEFSKKEHKGEDVMKLNQRGQMPTFKDGDTIVNESGAICMYLEHNYSKDNKLIPDAAAKNGEVYQRMFEADNLRAKVLEPIVMYKMRTKKEDWDSEFLKEKTAQAKEELKIWDALLKDKDYLCGAKFTMADVFFFPFVAFFFRQGAELADFPNLQKYYQKVAEEPCVKATWPPHWLESNRQEMLADL